MGLKGDFNLILPIIIAIPRRKKGKKKMAATRSILLQNSQANKKNTETKAKREFKVHPVNVANTPKTIFSLKPYAGIDVHLLTESPQIKKIFEQYYKSRKKTRYLSLPYIAHVIVFHNGFFSRYMVFAKRLPVKGINDQLFYAPFPNTDSKGRVCFGEENDFLRINAELRKISSLRGKLHKIIKEFYASTFTDHLARTHFIPWGLLDRRLSSFDAWEMNTRKNPDFILKINWQLRTAGSISQVMNFYWRN